MKTETQKLSPTLITTYRNVYRSAYGIEITGKQAYKEGVNLTNLLYIVTKYKKQQVPIDENPEERIATVVTPKHIERYKALYLSHYGIHLPWNQAVKEAESLMRLVKTVAVANARMKQKEVVH